jgi:hypothetical protein
MASLKNRRLARAETHAAALIRVARVSRRRNQQARRVRSPDWDPTPDFR